MIIINFLKIVHTAETFLQNLNDFEAKVGPLKHWHPDAFSKIHTTRSISILAIVSHRNFLVGSNHLSSTDLQN